MSQNKYHTGFYTDRDHLRSDLGFIEDRIDPSLPDELIDFWFLQNEESMHGICPYDFLHGNCDVFARYLHDTYGYDVEAIYHRGRLIHEYCTDTALGGRHLYIDIRGKTSDFQEFLEEFELEESDLWYSDEEFTISHELPPMEDNENEGALTAKELYQIAQWMDQYYKYWG